MDDGSGGQAGDAGSQLQQPGLRDTISAVDDHWLWQRRHAGVFAGCGLATAKRAVGAAQDGLSPGVAAVMLWRGR